MFVFGDFNVHHKNWLTYSEETDRYSDIIFQSQMTLLRWLTFLLGSQAVILTVLLFWIYFFLLTLVFVLQWHSLHWEILSRVSIDFTSYSQQMPHFIALVMAILMLIGIVFVMIWQMFHGRIYLNLALLLLLVNFVSGFRLELTYISLIESIRLSLIHLYSFQLLVLLS